MHIFRSLYTESLLQCINLHRTTFMYHCTFNVRQGIEKFNWFDRGKNLAQNIYFVLIYSPLAIDKKWFDLVKLKNLVTFISLLFSNFIKITLQCSRIEKIVQCFEIYNIIIFCLKKIHLQFWLLKQHKVWIISLEYCNT